MTRKGQRYPDGTKRDPRVSSLPIDHTRQERTPPQAYAPRRAPQRYTGGPTVGVRLRALREGKGWSKAHIASLLSLDPRTVSAVERGRAMWSTATKYAALFQFKLRPILTRNGFTSAEIGAAASLSPDTVEVVLSFIANNCKGDDVELQSVERVLFATMSPPIELV